MLWVIIQVPDDVYKAHLVEGRAPAGRAIDSARQNLASTFVNGFVNAGFGHDKLMTKPEEADGTQVTSGCTCLRKLKALCIGAKTSCRCH